MRTFSVLNGLPVISLTGGKEIGKVIDLLFHKTHVEGFLIDQNGWLNRHLFVPLENIHAIGHDALIIDDVKELSTFDKKQFPFYSLHNGTKKIVGKTLMSTEGEKLGLVEDVYFNENLGNIVGYEVTDGLIADLKEGKRVLKSTTPLTVGEEVLVIDLNC
ncbi:PRC-barrel domain-containing protein [Anaerobacillus sp. CMMVII]|uniref:PRC-barrel domain-containing protein n=1 Tax=Anaerobacillus sp. CMMVII TaxID=2755588 RepID=UPI0021B70E76|nr:PRC-barrel domain-containing protein [Anaerobacillus sp. CMMVII]MCT8139562.1 PRC-barrel domain-containing protein [Anaerobacillus sp. CMMVII]